MLKGINGQALQTLYKGEANGRFEKSFDLRDLANGVYLLEVKAGEHVWTEKLVKQ
jgi:hypothetical protein